MAKQDYEEIDLRTPWGRLSNSVKDSFNEYFTEERKDRIMPTLYLLAGAVIGAVVIKGVTAILWLAASMGLPM